MESKWGFRIALGCAFFTLAGEIALYIFEWMPLAVAVSLTGTYCVIVLIPYAPETRAERVYTFIGGTLMAGLGGLFVAMYFVAPPGDVPLFMVAICALLIVRGAAFMISSFMPRQQ